MKNKKHFILFFAITLLLIVNGCSPGKADIINEFKADPGEYTLIGFAEEDVDNVNKDVNMQVILKYPSAFHPKGIYDVNKKENKQKAKALGISEYPAYIVMDAEKIVMQTTEIEEVAEMAYNIFYKRINNAD